jgi:hypothetical protein
MNPLGFSGFAAIAAAATFLNFFLSRHLGS